MIEKKTQFVKIELLTKRNQLAQFEIIYQNFNALTETLIHKLVYTNKHHWTQMMVYLGMKNNYKANWSFDLKLFIIIWKTNIPIITFQINISKNKYSTNDCIIEIQ